MLPSGPIPGSCLQHQQPTVNFPPIQSSSPFTRESGRYLLSYPYGNCCRWPIAMLLIGPGGPLLYCSPIPLLGPGGMNCSPAVRGKGG